MLPGTEKEEDYHDSKKPLDGIFILLDRVGGYDLTALSILELKGAEKGRRTADPSD